MLVYDHVCSCIICRMLDRLHGRYTNYRLLYERTMFISMLQTMIYCENEDGKLQSLRLIRIFSRPIAIIV
jgi:hypothetical protein